MNPPKPDDPSDSERLDETRRELERLTKLRRDVARGLLEVSAAAKRDADRLLAADGGPTKAEDAVVADAALPSRAAAPRQGLSNPFLYGSFALGILCGILLAVTLGTSDAPSTERGVVAQPPTESVGSPVAAAPPEIVDPAPSTDPPPAVSVAQGGDALPAASTGEADVAGLVLTLRTHRACWLSVRVDGGDTVERLLPPDETVVLEVDEEAVLRIGDAAALSLLINDQPTRSLGRDGQVVELRITPSNFRTFLAG